jgi:hypothetical protein
LKVCIKDAQQCASVREASCMGGCRGCALISSAADGGWGESLQNVSELRASPHEKVTTRGVESLTAMSQRWRERGSQHEEMQDSHIAAREGERWST